jgi:hypothetical protein
VRTRSKSTKKPTRRVRLKDLAHFQIRSVRSGSNGQIELDGEFTHLDGVRLDEPTDGTVGFLFRSRKDSIYLLRKQFNPNSKAAVFVVWPPAERLRAGKSYPYIDYYWSPKQASFALEPASAWKQVLFKAEDAIRYRDPAVPNFWKSHVATAAPSKRATDVHVIKRGWDHEHCDLCRSRIGRSGSRHGYFSKADNDWLCVSCFKNFVAAHDLRFLQFKK